MRRSRRAGADTQRESGTPSLRCNRRRNPATVSYSTKGKTGSYGAALEDLDKQEPFYLMHGFQPRVKAALIDDEALGGHGALASVLAKQGQLEGYAVGGCCDLSTSVHHLVDKLGAELGYLMSEDTGYDVEDRITLATKD